MTPTLDEIIAFSNNIEEIASFRKETYMDSILYYCETTGLEFEFAAKLLSKNLRSKLQEQCEELNMIPKEDRLPF